MDPELLREYGGWGVAVAAATALGILWKFFVKLQDHALKMGTNLSTTNAKTVAALDVLKDQQKEGKRETEKVNEHLVDIKTMMAKWDRP